MVRAIKKSEYYQYSICVSIIIKGYYKIVYNLIEKSIYESVFHIHHYVDFNVLYENTRRV